MKKKSHKTAYIAEHGQQMWDLVNEYINHGNRSTEATNAQRLYNIYQMGLNGDTWTIYTIAEDSTIVYVGRTGTTLATRWVGHKSKSRTSNDTQPLHLAMMSTTDPATFPEWTVQILQTTTDKDVAIELEKLAIVAFGTNIHGYNRMIGGGDSGSKFKKV